MLPKPFLRPVFYFPLSLTPAVVTGVGAGACGGDNSLSEGEASRAFVEVMSMSTEVGSHVQAGCTTCDSSAISTVSGNVPCPGGGTVDYDGELDDGGPIAMALALGYSSCTGAGGITVDGSLDYSTTLAAAGDFAFTMLGALQFSGAVSGSCTFDLALSLTAGAYSAQGDLCGSTFSYP